MLTRYPLPRQRWRKSFNPNTLEIRSGKYAPELRDSFHPYYLINDFNNDGLGDLAAVLIDRRRQANSRFTLVIFHGKGDSNIKGKEPNDGGAFQAVFTQEGLDLRQGGLWAGQLDDGRTSLYVGDLETDDCTTLRWNGKGYVLNPCEGN